MPLLAAALLTVENGLPNSAIYGQVSRAIAMAFGTRSSQTKFF